MLRQTNSVLLGLALVFATAGFASATMYTITDLGVLSGGTQSYAMGVNDSGVVAGASRTAAGAASFRATIYTGGAWVNIGSAFNSSYGTFATGINDNGQVAGWLRGSGSTLIDSFIYNVNTQTYTTNIANQPGVANGVGNREGSDTYQVGSYTNAGPINSSGQIAGYYSSATSGDNDGFIWNGSSTTAVTTPATDNGTTLVSGINNSGVVVGSYMAGQSPVASGFYFNGSEHDINGMTYPEAIVGNTVVGTDYFSDDAEIYTLGGSVTNIGTLSGDTGSVAYALSSGGTVVGTSYSGTLNRAFIYNNGVMTDLNTLISGTNPFSKINYAMGISPNGNYIVGNGTLTSNGDVHAFLLIAVPTPEPSTLLLAASGLVGLLAYAWRKRK
jgi:probable HAF family extracellular repeat protein